jgi:hypothetical protein
VTAQHLSLVKIDQLRTGMQWRDDVAQNTAKYARWDRKGERVSDTKGIPSGESASWRGIDPDQHV